AARAVGLARPGQAGAIAGRRRAAHGAQTGEPGPAVRGGRAGIPRALVGRGRHLAAVGGRVADLPRGTGPAAGRARAARAGLRREHRRARAGGAAVLAVGAGLATGTVALAPAGETGVVAARGG